MIDYTAFSIVDLQPCPTLRCSCGATRVYPIGSDPRETPHFVPVVPWSPLRPPILKEAQHFWAQHAGCDGAP